MGSSGPSNVTYPSGSVSINPALREITGSNPERQDFIIGPNPATNFAGYFCARFSEPIVSFGTAVNGTLCEGENERNGTMLSGYARFSNGTKSVDVRVGVSFISVDQARKNLEAEIPDGTSLEETARVTREAWAEKLNRIQIEGASQDDLETVYTAFFHTLQVSDSFCFRRPCFQISLQYPYEQDEDGKYYSGYDETVHEGPSYTGYSNWVNCSVTPRVYSTYLSDTSQDIFRAQWGWLILFAPERIPGMVESMLHDYLEV